MKNFLSRASLVFLAIFLFSITPSHGQYVEVIQKKRTWLITIDGMEPISTAFSFWPEIQTINLYEAIGRNGYFPKYFSNNNGIILPFAWARDMSKSDLAVNSLYKEIKVLNDNNMPVIILAHSWGSVIAYITLQKNPDIYIEKLVTIGSPLASRNKAVATITRAHLAVRGIQKITKPCNIKTWHNYFVPCDSISARICQIGKDNNFQINRDYEDFSKCHSLYFEDNAIWDLILRDTIIGIHPMEKNWSWPPI